MKRFAICLLPLLLAACASTNSGVLTSPAAIAELTVVDEENMRRAEMLYKTARTVGELGVDAGVIKGDVATQVAAIDNKLYAALLAARRAYATVNSSDLLVASRNIELLVGQLQALVQGAKP